MKSTFNSFKKQPYRLLVFATIALTSSSYAAVLTWDAGNTSNGSTIDPGSGSPTGTWNTTAGNTVWNDGVGNVPWTQTSATAALNDAVFGGADAVGSATYAVNVGAALAAGKITFDNSGYVLSATSARTITIQNGTPRLIVAEGKTATIGANVTILGSTTFTVGATASGANGGTLNIESGATVRPNSSSNSLLLDGVGTIINVKTGGFLGLQSGVGNSGLTLASGSASANVTLNVDGGTVNVQSTGSTGGLTIGGVAGSTGTVTLSNSGSVIINAAKTNGLTFGSSGSTATNTFHLDGGTLTTRTVREEGGTSVFNFNGGTLQANSATSGTTFMTGLNTASVKSGGAKVDTNNFNVTIAQNLLDGGGVTAGGLTKSGDGVLTLTGTGTTYTGATVVKAGTLKLNTATTLSTSSKLVAGDTGSSSAVLDVTTAGLTVGGSQTLAGIGTVLATGQTVTVNGKLAAGDGGIGALAISGGALSMGSSSIFDWDINTTANTSDSVSVGTSLSVTSGAIFKIISNTAFTNEFWDTTRSWDVFGGKDFSGFSLNFLANNVSQVADDFASEGAFMFTGGGTNLTWTAVPEPTSALAGLLITAGLLRRRRLS